ncbi:MAG: LAGLIDADG family homing endonuclease [Patescibacteria group bacterium]
MNISNEYIRGLIEGEGSFTFHTNRKKINRTRYKLPAFVISMNIRDKTLLEATRDKLGLKSKINYRVPQANIQNVKTGAIYISGRQAILTVRDFKQLKDIIIPFFYKKLKGYKGKQFIEWLEKIGSDPDISDRYKSLYRLYKWGMYDKLPKFTEKFKD